MLRGRSTPHAPIFARLAVSAAAGWLTGLVILTGTSLGPSPARAFDQIDRGDRSSAPALLESRTVPPSTVEIGLPLAFQMRFRTTRVWGHVAPDAIDDRRVAGLQSSLIFDPDLNSLHPRELAVEGHLQITRHLGQGFELGLAWSSRSALSSGVGIELDRHFIGGVLRLVR